MASKAREQANRRPDFSLEVLSGAPSRRIVGVDEVGRGPLAGPVVAAALRFLIRPEAKLADVLNDSKKLSKAQRLRAYEALCHSPYVQFAVGAASVREIETENISNACKLAMRRAVERLPFVPDMALVDGIVPPDLSCEVKTVIGGDAKSLSIAAASIVAKVTRDRAMERLASRYSDYGWERNAGYGTATHQSAIFQKGINAHHRRKFGLVRELLSRVQGDAGNNPHG